MAVFRVSPKEVLGRRRSTEYFGPSVKRFGASRYDQHRLVKVSRCCRRNSHGRFDVHMEQAVEIGRAECWWCDSGLVRVVPSFPQIYLGGVL